MRPEEKRMSQRKIFQEIMPRVGYRLAAKINYLESELLDISETGLCLKASDYDQSTQVGDLLLVDLNDIINKVSKSYTARVIRVDHVNGKKVFGVEFVKLKDKEKMSSTIRKHIGNIVNKFNHSTLRQIFS